jgi:hypothetical protein
MSTQIIPRLRDMLPAALVVIILAVSVLPSLAENTPRPRRPFQEEGAEAIPLRWTVITPKQRTEEIEKWAREHEQTEGGLLERFSYCRIIWPEPAELAAMARYSLLILSIETQKPEELPVKRVYLRTPEREIPLIKLGTWRWNLDQKLIAYKRYGPVREDGFYLYPTAAMLRPGQFQVDLPVGRMAYPVLDFPAPATPDWLRKLQITDPDGPPDPKALERFLKKHTADWPRVEPAPEAAVPKPQAGEPKPQAGEPKAPSAGLKELFRK